MQKKCIKKFYKNVINLVFAGLICSIEMQASSVPTTGLLSTFAASALGYSLAQEGNEKGNAFAEKLWLRNQRRQLNEFQRYQPNPDEILPIGTVFVMSQIAFGAAYGLQYYGKQESAIVAGLGVTLLGFGTGLAYNHKRQVDCAIQKSHAVADIEYV